MNKEEKKEYDKKRYKENKEYILEKVKKYYQENREKKLAQHRIWRKKNPEYNKKYYQENKEKRLLANVNWRKKNPGYWKKYHERMLEYNRRWLKTEKGKANSQRSRTKRRTKEKEIINTLTAQEWLDILEKHNYRCVYCGIEFDCENLPTKEHVIPISWGGNNTKENVVPACKSCNCKKYNMRGYVNVD